MKPVSAAIAAILSCLLASPAQGQDAAAERWRAALQSARWTGPLLASTAETLPQGHVYTEPYLFDVISAGQHSWGSSGFYQYGLLNNYTVGIQPFFTLDTRGDDRGVAVGDFKLLSQLRISHFSAEHRVPSVALVMNLVVPTGKDDRLGALKHGHGSGSFAPEFGLNLQHYFLLGNGHLLRTRFNFLKNFPLKTDVVGRSVYGTPVGFAGRARPGSKTTLVGAAEYGITPQWVLAFDIERDEWGRTKVGGRNADGTLLQESSPKSWNIGFAPAVEYNWSARAGAILGVWIVPPGHNTHSSVTPAIAVQRFW